jgi:hypothetical protein
MSYKVNKVKLLKIVIILNNYVNRLLIDSYLSITHSFPNAQVEVDSEDNESIFVESYKMMVIVAQYLGL